MERRDLVDVDLAKKELEDVEDDEDDCEHQLRPGKLGDEGDDE